MKLIVGLGNPGGEYARTRHNAGFRVLDALAAKMGAAFRQRKFKGQFATGELPREWQGREAGDGGLLLVKPETFMNLSGETVVGFLGYYHLDRSALLVVCDDVNLALGALRMRRSGSAGGHNGLADIEQRLGHREYARLRCGVGGREVDAERRVGALVGHVLGRFAPEEEEQLPAVFMRAAEACLAWAGHGCEVAMNRFNAVENEKKKAENQEE
jgi:PTH1 family peptidyl-tRNA hydrolase